MEKNEWRPIRCQRIKKITAQSLELSNKSWWRGIELEALHKTKAVINGKANLRNSVMKGLTHNPSTSPQNSMDGHYWMSSQVYVTSISPHIGLNSKSRDNDWMRNKRNSQGTQLFQSFKYFQLEKFLFFILVYFLYAQVYISLLLTNTMPPKYF